MQGYRGYTNKAYIGEIIENDRANLSEKTKNKKTSSMKGVRILRLLLVRISHQKNT